MQQAEIEYAITLIVRDLVEDDTFVADTRMAAADLPGWDSFTHVEFIAALENRFDVRLPLDEVEGWRTLGDAVNSIAGRVRTP